ncbi:uncharacterized protein LOC108710580 [Xenopus laevis]|uniref:Uncharacterized protein n=2 Tax=Xenopus laevis TaxID=8355 RepID=A0A974DAV4_XENLA|nr:uncharacterized protein LOC108710580 [Xenopus laevis]OCT88644.1 hypothetical protein XELAEV_18017274mg [Xenopus laevis]
MKIAIVFLLVSLNCCLGTVPADKKDVPNAPVPKEPQPVPKPVPKVPQEEPRPVPKVPQQNPQPVPKVPQPVPQPGPNAPQPVSKIACLVTLLKNDAPLLLEKLGTLLCNYKVAQQEQNIALFMDFLNQVNSVLKKVGCSLNNIIGRKVVITSQNAEQLADQVAIVLFQFVEDIISRVMKILEDLPIIRDFVNDVPLTQDLRNVACGVMEHVIAKVTKILVLVADITGGLTKIIEGL